MQSLSLDDLESLISFERPEEYYVDASPLLAVVYQDFVRKIQETEGVQDFRELQGVSVDEERKKIKVDFSRKPAAVFVYEGRLVTVEAKHLLPDGMKIAIESPVDSHESLFLDIALSTLIRYDSDSIWEEAVKRGFSSETAKQYEKRMIQWEKDKNYRFVHVFKAGDGESYGIGWSFDGEGRIWPGDPSKSTSTIRDPSTMILSVGNVPGGYYSKKVPLIAAKADRPILNRDCRQAGLMSEASGTTKCTAYLADKSREPALLDAFDKLGEIAGLQVTIDGRKQ